MHVPAMCAGLRSMLSNNMVMQLFATYVSAVFLSVSQCSIPSLCNERKLELCFKRKTLVHRLRHRTGDQTVHTR